MDPAGPTGAGADARGIRDASAAPPGPSARARLREATREVHERLHHLPAFAALARGRIDLAGYRRLLARLHGFHAPVERRLRDAARHGRSCGIDPRDHARAPLLEADLLHLGLDRPALGRIPRCASLPGLGSAGRLLGCLYVLEGSRLGGRQLARGLDRLLGPGEADGRRFLAGGGEAPGEPWRRCCAAIERHGSGDDARAAEMAAAARETFACFENWLTESAA